jgi:hypothetical protein
VHDRVSAGAAVSARVLAVGLAGELPPWHAYRELAARAMDLPEPPPLALSSTLRRERKVRVIVEAAHRALAGAPSPLPGSLERCALVVVTRHDGQPANKIDTETYTIVSFAEMAPTTIAFSFVSHMASSCVPGLLGVRGPAVTVGSREGLAAGIRIAERWLGRTAEMALVIESDLSLPAGVLAEPSVQRDYALAVLLANGENGS